MFGKITSSRSKIRAGVAQHIDQLKRHAVTLSQSKHLVLGLARELANVPETESRPKFADTTGNQVGVFVEIRSSTKRADLLRIIETLQVEHLADVRSTDQQVVRPWFSGKLAVAPPVIDLASQGFTLVGGRLDTLDGKPVAAIVYRRGDHIINLFVGVAANSGHTAALGEAVQGFNMQRWSDQGFQFIAISDMGADELRDFHTKFETGLRAGA